MDAFIAGHGEFAGARRDKNQDAISFGRLVHAQAEKFFLRGRDRVGDGIVADQNTDFAGSFFLGLADRRHERVV